MANEPKDSDAGRINPLDVSPEDAAKLLTAAAGRRVEAADIRRALEAGAPALPDGRVNLVELAAWLEREVAEAR